jgi:hypothetical protein
MAAGPGDQNNDVTVENTAGVKSSTGGSSKLRSRPIQWFK